MKSYTIKDLQSKIDEIGTGIKVLDSVYINNTTKVKCVCQNGHMFYKTPHGLKRGDGCKECSDIKKRRLIDGVKKEVFEVNKNIEILSNKYVNNKQKLKFKCLIDGYEWESTLNNILRDHGCPKCGSKIKADRRFLTINEINLKLSEIGSHIIAISRDRDDANYMVNAYCNIHDLYWDINVSNLLSGDKCIECAHDAMRGENHPFWNPNLTNEERYNKRRGYKHDVWRIKVFEKDSYICQACKDDRGGNLNAHHLDGYNWCKNRRYDIANGTTLCKKCHDKFHSTYGYGYNTKNQFDEFLLNYNREKVM